METALHWLETHLLSCPVKASLGYDCPGCGFQRAGVALLRGDFAHMWEQYPPLLPFLVTMVLLVIALRTRLRYRNHALAASVATTVVFIAVNYVFKVVHYAHIQ